MNTIQVLDCTLRDGGYCNQWQFGKRNIMKITSGLVNAGVDIIECGFLTESVSYDIDATKFNNVHQIGAYIPVEREGKLFVCMMNYGEYSMDNLPEYDGTSIDGIRVAFHKKDMEGAIEICNEIQQKGYKVFIQAMVSLNYSDEEFLYLIRKCNEFEPYAFYIVDSFGVMKRKDMIRLFYEIEHNLNAVIKIGYHSHNNMQLAFANAQTLVDIRSKRDLILDASVFGMGRGAGNLNTELITEYLNDNVGNEYRIEPLLELMDEIIGNMYQQSYWGYSLPNYLSAFHNAHPNYASYLDSKKTLTFRDINSILRHMDPDERNSFDLEYIERAYQEYLGKEREHQTNSCINNETVLEGMLKNKKVLLVAPGKSVAREQDRVVAFAQKQDVLTIAVNFDYQYCKTDFIFVSNIRRYRQLTDKKISPFIVTSNIPEDKAWLRIEYNELLNPVEHVKDNAGLMAIRLMMKLGVKEIYLAGFDGYSDSPEENFADPSMDFVVKQEQLKLMNNGIMSVLKDYGQKVQIHFITKRSLL